MALDRDIPVILVGDYPWGTWRLFPCVVHFASLDDALEYLKGLSI